MVCQSVLPVIALYIGSQQFRLVSDLRSWGDFFNCNSEISELVFISEIKCNDVTVITKMPKVPGSWTFGNQTLIELHLVEEIDKFNGVGVLVLFG